MSTEQNKSAKLEGAGGEWISIYLGKVCKKIGSGATPRGGNDVYLKNGCFALIRSQNIYNDGFHREGLVFISDKHANELQGVEVLKDDVLLNITGDSVARVCQVDPNILPARVNQHVAIVRPDPKKLDPRFLRYYLISSEMQTKLLSWAGSGGTRDAITKGMIELLEILAPKDISEQRAIAHMLGTLDDKIELNRRTNETLEAMAQALFKFWFVDFGPVRAKMEGRWRRGQSLPGLPAHLFDLFPDRLVDSELGEIPEGWEVVKVSDIGKIVCGKTPSTKIPEYYGDDISFITIPDMHNNIFAVTTQKKLSYLGANSQTNKTLPPNTICISCIATPGLVIITTERSQTNQQINSIIINESNETYYWFWIFRNLNNIIKASGSGGSVLVNLSTGRFSELRILSSSKKLRQLYHLCIIPFFERVLIGLQENITLAALRDTLLPKLISGELRVKDTEKIIGG